jgi:hypothetical protein
MLYQSSFYILLIAGLAVAGSFIPSGVYFSIISQMDFTEFQFIN